MYEKDLPEPKRRVFSPEQRRARRWQLIVTSLKFCVAYTLLHKLFLPLALKLTSLKESPYAQVDFWFLYSIVLLWAISGRKQVGRLGSFLAGVGILYGIYEIYEVAEGHYGGWLAFSRLLSSIPLGFCCGVLMSLRSTGRKLSFAWLGVVILSLFLLANEYRRYQAIVLEPVATDQQEVESLPPATSVSCGAGEVVFDGKEMGGPNGTIQISECGLEPPVIVLDSSQIQIRNLRSSGLNLHLVYYENRKKIGGWNEIVSAFGTLSKPMQLSKDRVGLIYSDSDPSIGITLVVHSQTEGPWYAKRNPPRAWRKDDF